MRERAKSYEHIGNIHNRSCAMFSLCLGSGRCSRKSCDDAPSLRIRSRPRFTAITGSLRTHYGVLGVFYRRSDFASCLGCSSDRIPSLLADLVSGVAGSDRCRSYGKSAVPRDVAYRLWLPNPFLGVRNAAANRRRYLAARPPRASDRTRCLLEMGRLQRVTAFRQFEAA